MSKVDLMTDTEKAALERRIDELCAEVEAEKQRNAKLLEAAEKWMAKAAHFEAENAKLVVKLNAEHIVRQNVEIENAKLRELASILCFCMQVHKQCDDCKLNGAKGELVHDPLCACDGLHEILRELGIEVNE